MSSSTENNNQVPEMQQNLNLLLELPFFSAFPPQAIKLLAYLAERVQFAKEEVVIEEGDDYGRAYLILTGQLTLLRKSGATETVIKHFNEGDLLGSFSLLGDIPSLFQLQAATPTTALAINREHFVKIAEQFPQISGLALKGLLKELHQWERRNLSKADPCCLDRSGATVL
ncbi:MAG: Crp/Fnr family transcriptional regulator [Desulforhopalus sp.]